MHGCVRQPEGLAGAVLGRLALGAVPCQQAARGVRRAAYARHPRQLRRHPPAPDVHHLPPVLRTDARFRRAGRIPVRGGDADLCRAFAAAVVRAHLAVHQQLRDGDHRLAALLALAAERAGRAGGSGEHRVKCVSLRGYAVGRNFRLPDGIARTRRQEVHHPGGRGDARQRCQLRNPPQRRRRASAARPAPGPGRRAGDHPESVPRRRRPHQRRPPRRRADTPPARRQGRSHAHAAPATAAPPPPPAPAATPPQATPPPPAPSPGTQPVGGSGQAAPPPGAGDRLRHTVHGLEAYVPPSPRAAAGGSLASFLVRSGGLAGQRLSVKTPVVNIGRADYNDLVIPDPSVSTSHAKLQRREGVWVLVDLDSTNGTFGDGEQVKGDAPLAPGATVRLGDVQLVFEPSDDALSIVKGGGTQMLRTPHSTALNAPPRPASPPSEPPASPSRPPPSPSLRPQPPTPSRPGPRPKRPAAQQPPPKKGKGCGGSAAALVVGGGAIVALLHRLLA